jgi:uncharacterized protein DUF5309
MAGPVGTYTTYNAVGNREDLANVIYDITPTETPFVSMAKRTKATHTKHEWQSDALAAASASGQAPEGNNPTAITVTPTARVFNYCEINQRSFIVSGTQQAMNHAGREELAYQLYKYGAELKRNIESALSQNNGAAVGSSTNARVTASLESWISTNWTTQNASPTSAASEGFSSSNLCTAPVDATTPATVTEANVKAMIRAAWTAGGAPDKILVGPYNKVKVSGFSGILTNNIFQQAGGQAKIVAAADAYVSDFGTFQVIPSRFNRDRTLTILDMDYWAVAYLRPFEKIKLAKTGDSDNWMVQAEYCLESRNQKASAKVSDLSTS